MLIFVLLLLDSLIDGGFEIFKQGESQKLNELGEGIRNKSVLGVELISSQKLINRGWAVGGNWAFPEKNRNPPVKDIDLEPSG